MFTYGRLQTSNPLSPETSIQLYNPFNDSQNCHTNAIVDTGAVMTCIPESLISRLGRLPYDLISVRNPINKKNQSIQKTTYRIRIKIGEHNCGIVQVIAIPRQYALIGRDILNQHQVVLNAPTQAWGLNCCNEHNCPIVTQDG